MPATLRLRFLILALTQVAAGLVSAQDMEPRAYSNAPVGMNFFILTYGRSTGSVVVDASLPVEDVRAAINLAAVAYVRTMNFGGRSGKIAVVVPYAWGSAEGRLSGEPVAISRSGLADPRFVVSVNFVGAPALTPREFAAFRQKTIVGATLQVTAPLGKYEPNLRVNFGTNRWSIRPEIGVSHVIRRWTLEAYGSATFYTANDEYLNSLTLEQEPLAAVQGHVAYTFRPRLWAALDATYYGGGRRTVDGVKGSELLGNSRVGVTVSLPLPKRQSLKVNFSSGVLTRLGTDFNAFGVAFQQAW